ncbi:NAD(P)/FAD-dependent oxidoreductase [Dethiothermospora halolimnae]|uniref:NAD(P)/FAD-dependent oxidoreductase n=1 Tax=Dethiothermospora halolimnae TaxID=3114390 RepID=UPI003CCBFBCA
MIKYDIVIIGGGPAGLAAAIEAKNNGTDKVLIIERDRELGGILNQCIHNGFGLHEFNEELTGPEYAQKFINKVKELNIDYKLDTMVLDISKDKTVKAINKDEGFMVIKSEAVVLAMGCRERTRGAIRIPGTRPSGIFTAGTAQRFMNMEGYMVGKKVFILGSGDIGLIMARRLTLEGAEVIGVADIMPYPGGLTRNIVQCLDDFNIPLLLSHTVTDIKGKDRVSSITVARVDEKRMPIRGTEKIYDCDTLLLSVGLIPENELSESIDIKMNDITGGPIVNESMETNIDGIFACGNVLHVHDLVDYVTEESRRAGANASRYIKNRIKDNSDIIKTLAGKGIRYIIPNDIRPLNLNDNLNLFMRVDNIYEDVKLVVKYGKERLKEINKKYLTPGEMERIKIDTNKLDFSNINNITVEIEKRGE